jgi:MYXO-CTERM domain-containing protein
MKLSRIAVFFGSLSACLALATPSLANGRFPAANQLIVHPHDPNTVLLRATFGILFSHEAGKNSRLICDQIIGAASVVDPGVGFFDDGSIMVAAPVGLGISTDNGCSFQFVGGELADQRFIDVTSDRGNPKRALALSATQKSDGTENVRVFESTDNGRTWAVVSTGLEQNALVTTLDVAPSNSQRVYLSGNRVVGGALEGFVARSDDGGRNFTYVKADFPNANQIYIAAIDPFDADLVYLRTYGTDAGPSHLVVTRDGAKTFAIATTINSNMSGFALSPDGSRVAIAGLQTGVAVASRPAPLDAGGGLGMVFEEHSPLPMRCLGWEGNKLYGCGSGVPVGCGTGDGQFLLGDSTDEGRTWNTLIPLLSDILEPDPSCAAGTPSKAVCTVNFPATHNLFTCPFTVDAGADAADAGAADAGPQRPPPLDDCSCSVVGGGPGGSVAAVGAGLGALGLSVFALRRRSRKKRSKKRI